MRKLGLFAVLALAVGLYGEAVNAQETPPYGAPISLESAKKVMAAAEKEAIDNGWNVSITIVDSGGNVVMSQRFDNTSYGTLRLSEGKARTAVEFRNRTKVYQDAISKGGTGMRILSVSNAIFLEGGVPLIEDGKIVGGIGASGVPSDQDELVAMAGAAALK